MQESAADQKSIQQTQALRLTHLGHLHKEETNPPEKAGWAFRLAVALSEMKDGPSISRAKSLCQGIIDIQNQISKDLLDDTQNLLKTL